MIDDYSDPTSGISTLPILWVNDIQVGQSLNAFQVAIFEDLPRVVANWGKKHILCFDSGTVEQVYHRVAIALLNAGCQVEVIPLTTSLEAFLFGCGRDALRHLMTIKQTYLDWEKDRETELLDFGQAIDLARFWKQSGLSDLKISLKLEALRKRSNVSPYEWNRFLKLLEADIEEDSTDPDERLKLELKALLKESDPIKRLTQRKKIASHYRLTNAEVDYALKHLDEQSKSKQPQPIGLSELFRLPSNSIEYVIPGMLPVGETVLLIANPKTGKSLLAYDAAFAVATGEEEFLGEQVKQGQVLIIQYDETVNTSRGRLEKRGFRDTDDNVHFVPSFKISQLDLLEEWLERFRPTLVIIDSLRAISANSHISENSAEFADAIYQIKELIARYSAACILIHHTNKNQDAVGVERSRGSSAIVGAVWGVWELGHILKPDPNNKKKLTIDPKDPTRVLSVIARDVEGQKLRIELDPERNRWLTLGEEGAEGNEVNERKTHQDRILELLKSVAPTALEGREIDERLSIGRGVYNCLRRLQGKRLISSRPSTKDRRQTVYYCPKIDHIDSPPSLSPPPNHENVINYAESITGQELDNRSHIDHTIDHTLITSNEVNSLRSIPNQEDKGVPAIDHKNRSQGGREGVALPVINSTEPVINPISDPSDDSKWKPGDKFRSTSQHKSYRKYLNKVLTVRQDNPLELTVCAEETQDKFSYGSIERFRYDPTSLTAIRQGYPTKLPDNPTAT